MKHATIPLLIAFLLVNTARGEVTRERGLIAEGTKWENPYYVVDSGVDGPTLLVAGGVHGNEPAGHFAAEAIRHWPIRRGRLIVVPSVNAPGLAQKTRWLPGEPEATRNANRNFPRKGEPNEGRAAPVRALWSRMKEWKPDWVVDLHEGYDFRIANSKSDGSSIVYLDSPEMKAIAVKIQNDVNATIDDPNRRMVRLSKSGPVGGGLVRASMERLGAKGFCFETTYRKQPLDTRVRQHGVMTRRLMLEIGMLEERDVVSMAP